MPSHRGVLISPSLVECLQSGPTGLQSQMLWGFFLLITDPHTVELRIFIFCGRNSVIKLFSSLQIGHLVDVRFEYIVNVPSDHLVVASSFSLNVQYLFW